jgi:formylglycine-generating enzyme required for sulfatase activity
LPPEISGQLSKKAIEKLGKMLARNSVKSGKRLSDFKKYRVTRRDFIELIIIILLILFIGLLLWSPKREKGDNIDSVENGGFLTGQSNQPVPTEIGLEMVSIPSGNFLMGSPPEEEGRYSREGPQQKVSIRIFDMSKTPITQMQWRRVAERPTIQIALKLDPSKFKGDNFPVENISWDEAVEFCARLSKWDKTSSYRLPSEAEWEYACRAGTTTPFHFGKTVTTDQANYRGTDLWEQNERLPGKYGDGSTGEFRKQTTEVKKFPPNAWDLYGMHGNVGEWCADPWHENYKDSPTDGTVWKKNGISNEKVVRGGAWDQPPMRCRSASRAHEKSSHKDAALGFRVVAATYTGLLQGPM